MASPLQRQSLRRKITYFMLIIALFTAALVMRQAGSYSMEAVANRLEIREQNLGDVDLLGSAMKLMLTGARGLVVCFLWNDAQDKKKRHEWNELDQRIHLLAKLQPHFITPWLFQSWNLAYNVSFAFHRVKDKYYYVPRGINLLATCSRQNPEDP